MLMHVTLPGRSLAPLRLWPGVLVTTALWLAAAGGFTIYLSYTPDLHGDLRGAGGGDHHADVSLSDRGDHNIRGGTERGAASSVAAGARGETMAVGLKKRRRIQMVVAGGVLLAVATGIVGYAMRDGIEFFRSPSQLAEHPPRAGERFRLGGLVEQGSLRRGEDAQVRFTVTDGGAATPVVFDGILPDLVREGQGVIATGRLEGDAFVATEVLARHDESYMPKEVADALKEQGLFKYGGGVGGADGPGGLSEESPAIDRSKGNVCAKVSRCGMIVYRVRSTHRLGRF